MGLWNLYCDAKMLHIECFLKLAQDALWDYVGMRNGVMLAYWSWLSVIKEPSIIQ